MKYEKFFVNVSRILLDQIKLILFEHITASMFTKFLSKSPTEPKHLLD